ncbi:MAG: DDE-type integrase/transposase/recombinase [Planctomycetes bacterium]|nr:DDE-type integrase/transposase/recombinase [Planctomycetota bacterium]
MPSLRLWLKRHRELGPQGLEPSPRKRALPWRPAQHPGGAARGDHRNEGAASGIRQPQDPRRALPFPRAEGSGDDGDEGPGRPACSPSSPGARFVVVAARNRRGAFERARPGELWQSDITSLVLRREGRRVYLTVFMDDHSRYVVARSLRLSQRQELVTECLLDRHRPLR